MKQRADKGYRKVYLVQYIELYVQHTNLIIK